MSRSRWRSDEQTPLHGVKRATGLMDTETPPTTQLRESGAIFQRCANPCCSKAVEPKKPHAPIKLFCSAECTRTAWALRRVAELYGLSVERMHQILMDNRNE
jgi:hypothetical protein